MGKHSGRHAFRKKLAELGYELGDNALNEAFARFKELADKKKEIFDEDLVALVDDEIRRRRSADQGRLASRSSAGPRRRAGDARARDRRRRALGRGRGQRAGRCHLQRDPGAGAACRDDLQLFQMHAVTEGTDAQAEVTVRLEENGKTVNGQGAETDTLVASARAYVTR